MILSKDSTQKIAGIGDTLNIRGVNFGNTKGELFFKAADDGGQNYLRGLDDQYHLYWSDTLIQVLVPSLVYKGYENLANHNWSGGAGSGKIKIRTFNGDTNKRADIDSVFVSYSITNIKKNGSIIRRVYLARQNCDYDYQFTLHREFEQNPIQISVIDTALKLWSRLTGLTLQLERNAMGDLVFEDSVNVIGKNIIFYTSNPNDRGAMAARLKTNVVQINNSPVNYRDTNSNIRIKRQPPKPWSYALSESVGDSISFYHAFLHEIGHILLLGHVCNKEELMYYGISVNSPILVPDTSSWAVKGVLANIEASRNINWPSNNGLYPIGVKQPKITVADNQAPILCNGESITLQSNYPTEQHVWSTGETTPSITVQNGGTYFLSIPDGVCNLTDTIQIGSSALQVNLITTPTTCPNGADGSITAQVTGNYPPFTYLWSGNGIISIDTPQINNLSTGTYDLIVIDNAGCQIESSTTISSIVNTLTICIPGLDSNCPSSSSCSCRNKMTTSVSGGVPPYQYHWYYGTPGITTPPSHHTSYLSTTDCVCNVTISDLQSLYIWVTDSCGQSAIREVSRKRFLEDYDWEDYDIWDVKISPNPADSYVEIHIIPTNNINKVELYDVYGRLIRIIDVNNTSIQINVSELSAGMYFIRAFSENEIKTISFVRN